jgi:hypothetical protein
MNWNFGLTGPSFNQSGRDIVNIALGYGLTGGVMFGRDGGAGKTCWNPIRVTKSKFFLCTPVRNRNTSLDVAFCAMALRQESPHCSDASVQN